MVVPVNYHSRCITMCLLKHVKSKVLKNCLVPFYRLTWLFVEGRRTPKIHWFFLGRKLNEENNVQIITVLNLWSDHYILSDYIYRYCPSLFFLGQFILLVLRASVWGVFLSVINFAFGRGKSGHRSETSTYCVCSHLSMSDPFCLISHCLESSCEDYSS